MSLSTHITSLPTTSSCWPGSWWNGCCYRKCNFKTRNVPQHPQHWPVYYPYQPQHNQFQQQYPTQYGFYKTDQSLNINDSGLGPINSIKFDGVQKQYLHDFKKVEHIAKPVYSDVIDASPIPEETIRHKLDNSLKEKMKITAEEIQDIEQEESTQAKMKRNRNIISPDENVFGSTQFLNDEQIKSNDDDDFFDSDSFYDFGEAPVVSIEAAGDLPLCSDLSDIETEIGVECFTEERNRDEVLEKILQQTWDMLDVSS
jgi:hypothetical protein